MTRAKIIRISNHWNFGRKTIPILSAVAYGIHAVEWLPAQSASGVRIFSRMTSIISPLRSSWSDGKRPRVGNSMYRDYV